LNNLSRYRGLQQCVKIDKRYGRVYIKRECVGRRARDSILTAASRCASQAGSRRY